MVVGLRSQWALRYRGKTRMPLILARVSWVLGPWMSCHRRKMRILGCLGMLLSIWWMMILWPRISPWISCRLVVRLFDHNRPGLGDIDLLWQWLIWVNVAFLYITMPKMTRG